MTVPPRSRRRWTEGDEEVLREMRENGEPIRKIAERLGRTFRAVEKHLSEKRKVEEVPFARKSKWGTFHPASRWWDELTADERRIIRFMASKPGCGFLLEQKYADRLVALGLIGFGGFPLHAGLATLTAAGRHIIPKDDYEEEEIES